MVQDHISHEKYGVYAAVFSLSFLFINLADFGVNSYIARKFSEEQGPQEVLFANALTFKIIACLIYPFLVLCIGCLVGYQGEALYYLFIFGLVQALLQTVSFFRANFQARQIFRVDALASIADKIILLVLVLILLHRGITLSSFIHAVLLSAFLTCLFFFIVLVRVQGWIGPVFNPMALKNLLKQSFPFAMIALLFAVNERVDMVMLERLGGIKGKEHTGLYAAAYRWLDAIMMYLWTILPVFFAKFSYHQKEPEEQQKIFNLGQLLTFIPMCFAGVFVLFYGDKLFWMFIHSTREELDTMGHLVRILFIGTMVQGIFTIYGTYLNATGHEKSVSWMIVGSLIMNIALNWIFIPAYGPVAAACATLASTVFVCVLYMVYVARKTPLKVPVQLLTRLSLISLSFVLVFYLLSLSSMSWWMNSMIAGIFLLGITYTTNTGNIQSILKGK